MINRLFWTEKKRTSQGVLRGCNLRIMATIKLFPFILLVFYKCASFNVLGSSVFTNTWAVKLSCYERCGVVLEQLARKHGFVNESQVSGKINLLFITLLELRSDRSKSDRSTYSQIVPQKIQIVPQYRQIVLLIESQKTNWMIM